MKRERSNRVLCLWLPQWPLQRMRLARPELKRRELVLYEKQAGSLRVIASDKYSAGRPLAEVTTGHAEPHDPHADQTALLQLAAWCEQFSPTVGVEGPDNLLLDVTGLGPLFGDEELLARQVTRAFQRRGLVVRVALADTVGAAWAMAHFGNDSPVILPPGEASAAIGHLPVAALRLSDEIEILAELGIERIGQLLTLPRDPLATRFDPQLLLRLDQAMGLVPEPIASHRPPPEITVETRLEYPAEDRRMIACILRELLERVAISLAERQQGAIQIVCELSNEPKPLKFLVGLYRASANPNHLLELTQMQLDRAAIPGPIDAVKLSVVTTAPIQTWQQHLFEQAQHEERRQVGLLIDRLSNRMGREAVVRAIPQPEAQPEMAFHYEPLTGSPQQKTKSHWKSLPRPLRLEHEPVSLDVLSVVPDGPPIQFQWHGEHRVAHAWGPERIQTGWWRGRYVQRDYYRIETTAGKRFWLFRRLSDAKWFLHGVFD